MREHRIAIARQLPSLLKAMRRHRGLSQRQVAADLGLTQQAVSQLEGGASTQSFERVWMYCRALGFDVIIRDSKAGIEEET